jgi:hypothetical protein
MTRLALVVLLLAAAPLHAESQWRRWCWSSYGGDRPQGIVLPTRAACEEINNSIEALERRKCVEGSTQDCRVLQALVCGCREEQRP